MAIYELYGFLSNDIDEAKNSLESAFNIKFEAHDSSYHEGDYFRSGKSINEHFILKRNVDPYDNEPVEISYSEYPILLYINDTLRSVDLKRKIDQKVSGFILLRHEKMQ
ncbi:hypothetical protein [Actimicrobium sp. CCI2.3]|uniref:hypothetical protein n=1 Tax=Actimicrobium sp. CCI2.3 TaxID=3048616 RepID=UPI002AB40714|nr:hypothetical protein [Actimicrobium sp. CCI2.3]MDY7574616.1 hypothetical protein [Actimicrobium sp. CCI2.3]MEB0023885.1 hypothetical protein [Actimicrobium sp. CCI2.3]